MIFGPFRPVVNLWLSGILRWRTRKDWQPQRVARMPAGIMVDVTKLSGALAECPEAQTKNRRHTPMKILLQHQRNKLYFRRMGVWTSNPHAAFDFEHSERAIAF